MSTSPRVPPPQARGRERAGRWACIAIAQAAGFGGATDRDRPSATVPDHECCDCECDAAQEGKEVLTVDGGVAATRYLADERASEHQSGYCARALLFTVHPPNDSTNYLLRGGGGGGGSGGAAAER